MHVIAFCFFVLSVLLPVTCYSQQPTRLYVNRTDTTCGGKSPCYTNLQTAIDAAQPGNIVRIQAGTYIGQITISNKNNYIGSTELHRIIIESDPAAAPDSVVLRGSGQRRDDEDRCEDDARENISGQACMNKKMGLLTYEIIVTDDFP
jgi:hypothetical protein